MLSSLEFEWDIPWSQELWEADVCFPVLYHHESVGRHNAPVMSSCLCRVQYTNLFWYRSVHTDTSVCRMSMTGGLLSRGTRRTSCLPQIMYSPILHIGTRTFRQSRYYPLHRLCCLTLHQNDFSLYSRPHHLERSASSPTLISCCKILQGVIISYLLISQIPRHFTC